MTITRGLNRPPGRPPVRQFGRPHSRPTGRLITVRLAVCVGVRMAVCVAIREDDRMAARLAVCIEHPKPLITNPALIL